MEKQSTIRANCVEYPVFGHYSGHKLGYFAVIDACGTVSSTLYPVCGIGALAAPRAVKMPLTGIKSP